MDAAAAESSEGEDSEFESEENEAEQPIDYIPKKEEPSPP